MTIERAVCFLRSSQLLAQTAVSGAEPLNSISKDRDTPPVQPMRKVRRGSENSVALRQKVTKGVPMVIS